ncbi:MAG: FMN-binding protein [Eubacterium sp.]|nr:FMN-binding protein [Eubacterium sp.]
MRRKHLTRIGAAALGLVTAVGTMFPANFTALADTSTTYYTGTYEGSATGYGGTVTLAVTIGEDKTITDVTEKSQTETASYWEKAKTLFTTIVEEQTWDVDTVSGATVSSNAIRKAAKQALEKAALDPDGPFTAGTGEESNPYEISTAEGLEKFATLVDGGTTYEGVYIELANDIELDSTEKWNPIGTENGSSIFQGNFNGNGYTISGMTITGTYSGTSNIGLFSVLGASADVEDVTLTDVDIDVEGSSALYVGAIAGKGTAATSDDLLTVNGISVKGSIKATTTTANMVMAGGIIGYAMNYNAIVNSYTNVEVEAASQGNISCYAGGITAMSGKTSLIFNDAVFGNVTASAPLCTNIGIAGGGIAGLYAGQMWNVAATGNVILENAGVSSKWIGTICGEITNSGMTVNSETGVYDTYPSEGILRGYAYYADDMTLTINTYSDATTIDSTQTVDLVGTGSNSSTLTDEAFEATKTQAATMQTTDFASTMNTNFYETEELLEAYGFSSVVPREWEVNEDNRVVPTGDEWYNPTPDTTIFASGTGTSEDPYMIETEDQLRNFAASLDQGITYKGYTIKLANDIELTTTTTWTPVGGSDYAFDGTFDGGGYTVSGMTIGTEDSYYEITNGEVFIGFFGVLNTNAVVENLNLTDISIFVSYDSSVFAGGIVGYMDSSASTYQGATINNCSVDGDIDVQSTKNNTFAAGIAGYQYKGVIINSHTSGYYAATVDSGDGVAEVGGLVGLNNRGLVANNYSTADVYGSASRDGGDEGMAAVSSLVAVQAGNLVGCYGAGNHTAAEYSYYVGAVSGWITGIGKSYSCLYNGEATMKIDGETLSEVESVGNVTQSGTNEEGEVYTGGLTDNLTAYTSSTYTSIADTLNSYYEAYPVDIASIYGLDSAVLNAWEVDESGNVVPTGEAQEVTYVQPECEIVQQEDVTYQDGTWYGRDDDESVVVKAVVKDGAVTKETVVSGDETDAEAYAEALNKAVEKSVYGDTTTYEAVDASKFAGGSGTKSDPYKIRTEAQLRYIAEALNEDVNFKGVYFKQVANITLSDDEWLPIGWGIYTKINGVGTQYCIYPFKGNYDGQGYTIKNLTIGSKSEATQDPRMQYVAGMFGMVSGDNESNALPSSGTNIPVIKNIVLSNELIHTENQYTNYVGGFAGNLQNGFEVDQIKVTGTVISDTTEAISRAGGLAGNLFRGTVTNCAADVEVTATTTSGNSYGGGLYAMDNRVTTVNSYALGDVVTDAGNNNKAHAGGLVGQTGGLHYNCYAAGNVTALKTTTDVGALNGRLAGIAVENNCYYNSEATLTKVNATVDTVANGVQVLDLDNVENAVGKTKAQLASDDFVELLNANIEVTSAQMETIEDAVENINTSRSQTQINFYTEDGSDLSSWSIVDGLAGLKFAAKEDEQEDEETDRTSTSTVTAPGKVSSVTVSSKPSKKKVVVSYGKVKNADGYAIAYKLNNASKWTVKYTTKTSYTISSVKNKCVKVKVAAYTLNGSKKVLGSYVSGGKVFVNKATIKKVKKGKKSLKVTYKKESATGYQIQYSTSSKFKNAKTIKVTSAKKTSKTIKKLAKKKKYYVRVRAYKKIGSTVYYGTYSSTKSCKTK